jgi:hypothetical protein
LHLLMVDTVDNGGERKRGWTRTLADELQTARNN